MKKSSLIICNLCLITLLTGCGQSSEYTRINSSILESTEEAVTESTISENTIENITEEVIYTQEKADKIKDYLESYSTIYTKQTISMGVANEVISTESSLVIYADTANSVFNMNTSYLLREEESDLEESTAYRYNMICDSKNNINIIQQEDGSWVEADGTYSIMDWDFSIFTTPYDVYKYLIGDCTLELNTKGTKSDNYEYYTVTDKAASSMLSGVDYDEVKTLEVNYIFEDNGKDYIPKSCTVEIIYTKDNVDYSISSTIQISNVDNVEIKLPEYTRSGEVRKSEGSAEDAITD